MADEQIDIPQLILSIANAVVPLLIIVLLGFACIKGKVLKQEHVKGLNTYVIRFGLPIMFFNALCARKITIEDVKYCFVSTISAALMFIVLVLVSLVNNAICKCKGITANEMEIVPGDNDGANEMVGNDDDKGEVKEKSSTVDGGLGDENDEEAGKIRKNKKRKVKKVKKTKKARRRDCKRMWSLKPMSFTAFVSDFLICSYANTVFVGQPLIACIMGDEAAAYYPFIGDLGFMIIVFAVYTGLLEYAKFRRDKKIDNPNEGDGGEGEQIIVNAEIRDEPENKKEHHHGDNTADSSTSSGAESLFEIRERRRTSIYTDMASFVTGHDYEGESKIRRSRTSLLSEKVPKEDPTDKRRRSESNKLMYSEKAIVHSSSSSEGKSDSSKTEEIEEGIAGVNMKDATSSTNYSGDLNQGTMDEGSGAKGEGSLDAAKKPRCPKMSQSKCCIKMKSTVAGRIFLRVVTMPLIHGALLGLIVSFIPFTIPAMITQLVTTVANSCTAVAVFSIGMFMGANLKQLKNIRCIYHIFMKQIIFPLVVIAVLKLMRVDNYHSRASMICLTTSTATMTFAFLFDYKGYYNWTPGPIVIGLLFLFPQQIMIQIVASYLFPVELNPENNPQ